VHQLYIISLRLFSLLPSVTTWSDMSGNIRKNQVTRLVTLRHRSTMSGALVLDTNELHDPIYPAVKNRAEIHPAWNITIQRHD
jgi:hypothetical protein